MTRYDPSQPYAEQFTILSYSGKPPTEEQVKQTRQRGIARGERLERPGDHENDAQPRVMLNGSPALADLQHATVVEESFRKREGGHESARGAFERVISYRDRFGVKIGPLRTIAFGAAASQPDVGSA